ncbi:MAG: nicotinate (nicotinamide) nucleotide adenylyltransferase [Candidatus Omnitrophica bacterium]|nr:nicotinate (nicotinamide) nucleotide adenylyltransferase [Candidatus Omnitrophota bacterium]
MKRIGFYGGRFNPIHYAHLILAQCALEELRLDQVLFMPSGGRACYKSEDDVAPGPDRLEMVRLAIASNPRFEASSYEIDQPRFCFTIDTLRRLRDDRFSGDELILLVGGDWSHKIPTWKEGAQLLDEFQTAVFPRPGAGGGASPALHEKTMHSVAMPLIDISSSMIRDRVRNGLSIEYLTPPPVRRYIENKGLYR